jgi:hypothetical protein
MSVDPPTIALDAARLDEHIGTYRLNPEISYVIGRSADNLTGYRVDRPAQPLSVEAPDLLFVAGQLRLRKIFLHDSGALATVFVDWREERDLRWECLP